MRMIYGCSWFTVYGGVFVCLSIYIYIHMYTSHMLHVWVTCIWVILRATVGKYSLSAAYGCIIYICICCIELDSVDRIT